MICWIYNKQSQLLQNCFMNKLTFYNTNNVRKPIIYCVKIKRNKK